MKQNEKETFFSQLLMDNLLTDNQKSNQRQEQRISRQSNQQNGLNRGTLISAGQEKSIKLLISKLSQGESNYNNLQKKQINVRKVIKIQATYRSQLTRKKYKGFIKLFKYRKFIIKEIIQTEEGYVKDLGQLNEQILIPIKNQKIISSEDIKFAFSNIQDILNLNKSMLEKLEQKFKNYQPYQLFCDTFLEFILFFKLYFTYCNNYEKGQKKREQLKKIHSSYQEFIQSQQKFKYLELENYLVKPIQRLPKYVLLIKDLLKHTPKDHPDYQNIVKCLKSFEKINEENNEKMDKIIKSNKIFELQKLFELNLQKKNFIFEEQLTLHITIEDQKPLQCYFLNDMIILAEKQIEKTQQLQLKLYKTLELNWQSQCKEMPDTKYYANMLKIVGIGMSIFLMAPSQQAQMDTVTKLQSIIENLASKNNSNKQNSALSKIQVSVIGTEEHNLSAINKYTAYVIEVKMNSIIQKLYLRYSEIKDLEDYSKKHYKNLIIPHFSSLQWFQNHSNKLLEQRKLQIENLISSLLSFNNVQQNPKEILARLGLPSNFFQKDFNNVDADQKYLMNQFSQGSMNQKQQMNEYYADRTIEKLNIAKKMQPFIDSLGQNEKKNLKVYLLDERCIVVEIDSTVKSIQICELIAEKLGLLQFYDFKLFMKDSSDVMRVIEDDQILMKALPKGEGNNIFQQQERTSLKKIFKIITQEINFQILFQKYVFMPAQLEEIEYMQDKVRLQLLLAQQFYNIQKNKYNLSNEQYVFYASVQIYQKWECQKSETQQFPFEDAEKMISTQVYKQLPKDIWKGKILRMIEQLNAKTNEIAEEAENSDKLVISSIIAMNSILQNPYFGYNFFQVESPKKMSSNYDILLKKLPQQYLLGINYNGVKMINPLSYWVVQEVKISEIQNITAFPNSIQFVTKKENKLMRFKTSLSYQIMQILNEYIEMNQYL